MEDKIFRVVLLASLAHCDPKLQWEGLLARVQGQATHFRIFKPQKIGPTAPSPLWTPEPQPNPSLPSLLTIVGCARFCICHPSNSSFYHLCHHLLIHPAPKIHPLCRLAASPSSDESHPNQNKRQPLDTFIRSPKLPHRHPQWLLPVFRILPLRPPPRLPRRRRPTSRTAPSRLVSRLRPPRRLHRLPATTRMTSPMLPTSVS